MKPKAYLFAMGRVGNTAGHFIVAFPDRNLYSDLKYTYRLKGLLSDREVYHKQVDALTVGDVLCTTTGSHIVITSIKSMRRPAIKQKVG